MADRDYDVVLFGATGFTGGLTAEYLAEHADPGTRWALAGRRPPSSRMSAAGSAPSTPSCRCSAPTASDPASMRALAESTRVVITTVGPYIKYGEPLVAACAAAGTSYVDLTGEPEFVDLMWLRYHARGRADRGKAGPFAAGSTRSRTTWVRCLRSTSCPRVRRSGSRASSASAPTSPAAPSTPPSTSWAGCGRVRGSPASAARRSRGRRGGTVRTDLGRPHHDDSAGGWAVPSPTIDPQTVARSASALDRYGPDFTYSHYLVVKQPPDRDRPRARGGGGDRARAARADPQPAAEGRQGPRRGSVARAAREGVVQRPDGRLVRRQARRRRGQRRRPGLRRDLEDAF